MGLTDQKVLLSINDSNIFENLKKDELKAFEKFGKDNTKLVESSLSVLAEIFAKNDLNVVRIFPQIKVYEIKWYLRYFYG